MKLKILLKKLTADHMKENLDLLALKEIQKALTKYFNNSNHKDSQCEICEEHKQLSLKITIF